MVAPTRIVLDGRRGAEVILNNIGSEEATYRISLELRRMGENGKLDDMMPEEANDVEKAALEIIRFAPRRVTLPPNQPQSIRVGLASDRKRCPMANIARICCSAPFPKRPQRPPLKKRQWIENKPYSDLRRDHSGHHPQGRAKGDRCYRQRHASRAIMKVPTLQFDLQRRATSRSLAKCM